MVFRSGKYQGHTVQEVAYSDPSYLQWVRINRPEMLIERKPKPKAQKLEISEDEIAERQQYKNIRPATPEEAF